MIKVKNLATYVLLQKEEKKSFGNNCRRNIRNNWNILLSNYQQSSINII